MMYLYLKTHNKTGLKYLGKTEQDPFKYNGSGKYWKKHLKKHGYDIDTQILLQTEDAEEIKKAGISYSKLWNIVESDEWANFRPEEGDGGASYGMLGKHHTEEYKKQRSLNMKEEWSKRDKHDHGKKISSSWSEERKQKHSNLIKTNNPNRKGNSHTSGRIWVNNGNIESLIPKDDLFSYVNMGFSKGRK